MALIDVRGRAVQNSQDIDSGYYVYDQASIDAMNAAGTNPCGPSGIRPGFIHVRGAGRVNTCSGRILTQDLPDMHLVNSPFRPWMIAGLTIVVVGLGIGAFVEFRKWLKR